MLERIPQQVLQTGSVQVREGRETTGEVSRTFFSAEDTPKPLVMNLLQLKS